MEDDENLLMYILPGSAAAAFLLIIGLLMYRRRIWRCIKRPENEQDQHHFEDHDEEREPLIGGNRRVDYSVKNEGRGLDNAHNLPNASLASHSLGSSIPACSEDNCIRRSEIYQGSAVLGWQGLIYMYERQN